MQRLWLRREEIEGIYELFRRELKATTNYIPFEHVLPLLIKPEPSRIIWSRTARQEFARWGIKVGLRHHKEAFVVRIVDPERWRKAVTEPAPVEVPCIQDDRLDDDEYNHLIPEPDLDYVMPHWANHLQISINEGENILITGPCGAGKSSVIRELCARNGRKLIRINLNGETSTCEILGQWRIGQGKQMVFQYGPVPQAMKIGAILLVDEIDLAKSEILMCMQALLEEGGKLHIPDTNEWITPHIDFRFIATSNTVGKGDSSGLYAGTNVLNEAFLDRFHSVFTIDYLPTEQELDLLRRKVKGLNFETAERMVKVAQALRQALKENIIYTTFSTRKLIAWGKKTVQIGCPKQAAVYSIYNKLTEDEQKCVMEIFQRFAF